MKVKMMCDDVNGRYHYGEIGTVVENKVAPENHPRNPSDAYYRVKTYYRVKINGHIVDVHEDGVLVINVRDYWTLSANQQALVQRKLCHPHKPYDDAGDDTAYVTVEQWWDDDDDPMAETSMEGDTTVTLYSDGRIGLSNPEGLPQDLVDGLLKRAKGDAE